MYQVISLNNCYLSSPPRLHQDGLPLSVRAVLHGAIAVGQETVEGVAVRGTQVDKDTLGLHPGDLFSGISGGK